MTGGGKIDIANDKIEFRPCGASFRRNRHGDQLHPFDRSRHRGHQKFFFGCKLQYQGSDRRAHYHSSAAGHDVGMGFRRSWNSEAYYWVGRRMEKKRNLKTARQRSLTRTTSSSNDEMKAQLQLYTRKDCCLCEEMKSTLSRVGGPGSVCARRNRCRYVARVTGKIWQRRPGVVHQWSQGIQASVDG